MRTRWLLLVILALAALALALRLVGLGWGLPSEARSVSYHPDELTWLRALSQMSPGRLDFNPRYFDNPSFTVYAVGATIFLGSKLGLVTLQQSEEFYLTHPGEWAKMYLAGRLLSVLFGVATVVLIVLVARRMWPRSPTWVPLLAGLFLAILPGHVIHSHYLMEDTMAAFWVLLAFYFLVGVAERGRARDYAAAGIAIGLACGTKYNALPLLGLLVVAYVLAVPSWRAWRELFRPARLARLALSLVLAGVAFLATTPYAVLDWPGFSRGFLATWSFVSTARADATPAGKLWQVFGDVLPAGLSLGIYLLTIAGVLLIAVRRPLRLSRAEVLALVWIVLILGAAVFASAPTIGRILVVLPFLALWAAAAVGEVAVRWRPRTLAPHVVLAGVVLAVAGWALLDCLWVDAFFLDDSARHDASVWLETNVPAGRTVGLPYQGPFWDTPDLTYQDYWHPELTGGRYRYETYEFDPARLRAQPADVLVVSSRDEGKALGMLGPAGWQAFADTVSALYRDPVVFQTRVQLPGGLERPWLYAHLFTPRITVWQRGGSP